MKVLNPSYSGTLTFYTRPHSVGSGYLFLVVDEQTKDSFIYKIPVSKITETDYTTTIEVSLSVEDSKFYKYQLFTQDGSVSNSTQTEDESYALIYSLHESGKVLKEITSGKIFCTTQTDLERYVVQKDEYISEDSDNDFIINES